MELYTLSGSLGTGIVVAGYVSQIAKTRPYAPCGGRERKDLPPLGGCVRITLGTC